MLLRYGDAVASIQANWITPVKIRRLSIRGTKGLAEVDYIDQTLKVYEAAPELVKGSPWDFFAVSRESSPVDVAVQHCEPLRAKARQNRVVCSPG